ADDINNVRTTTKYSYSSALPIAMVVNATDAETKVAICESFTAVSGGSIAENLIPYTNATGGTPSVTYSQASGLMNGSSQLVTIASCPANSSAGVAISMGNL